MDLERRHITTPLKTFLLKRGWGEAINLLDCLVRCNPDGFDEWARNKSTTYLRRICEPYKGWSIYHQRNDPLPFDNDVCALDTAVLHITKSIYTKG